MAKSCPLCKEKMNSSAGMRGCTATHLQFKEGGKWYERNSKHFDNDEFCGDCGIRNEEGRFHHIFCEVERCPKCGNQLARCQCFTQETAWKSELDRLLP